MTNAVHMVSTFIRNGDQSVGLAINLLQIRIVMGVRLTAFFAVNLLINCLLVRPTPSPWLVFWKSKKPNLCLPCKIYRLYMVRFQSLRVIILPVLLMLVYVGSAIAQIVVIVRMQTLTPHSASSSWEFIVWASVNVRETWRYRKRVIDLVSVGAYYLRVHLLHRRHRVSDSATRSRI